MNKGSDDNNQLSSVVPIGISISSSLPANASFLISDQIRSEQMAVYLVHPMRIIK